MNLELQNQLVVRTLSCAGPPSCRNVRVTKSVVRNPCRHNPYPHCGDDCLVLPISTSSWSPASSRWCSLVKPYCGHTDTTLDTEGHIFMLWQVLSHEPDLCATSRPHGGARGSGLQWMLPSWAESLVAAHWSQAHVQRHSEASLGGKKPSSSETDQRTTLTILQRDMTVRNHVQQHNSPQQPAERQNTAAQRNNNNN